MNALILELKIRSLIEDKRMVTSQADVDLSRGGWRMDYTSMHSVIDAEIQRLLDQLEKMESK